MAIPNDIFALPPELIFEILQQCTWEDRERFRATSRTARNIVDLYHRVNQTAGAEYRQEIFRREIAIILRNADPGEDFDFGVDGPREDSDFSHDEL